MAEADAEGKRASGTGVVLRDPLPWPEEIQIVETAEATGYRAVFVPEIAAREAFTTLTGFGSATERVLLGTGVATMWARTPAITAMAWQIGLLSYSLWAIAGLGVAAFFLAINGRLPFAK